MRESRFSETRIVHALKEYEAGKSGSDLCKELGITKQTFYNWYKKYGGMGNQDLKRLKELEEEHRRLKQVCTELTMDNKVLKDVIAKKL